MNLYSFPKTRHARTEQPIQHRDYRAFKPTLRREFRERCVYCCAPDAGLTDGYGVDHYRPKSLFPDLIRSYGNLFYSCNSCNARKGPFWPGPKEEQAGHFVPNPCEHVMFGHLRYRQGAVEARTPAGEFTLKLLDLNNPAAVGHRNATLAVLQAATEKRMEAADVLKSLLEKRSTGQVTGPAIDAAVVQARGVIDRLYSAIRVLTGG